MTQSQPTEFPSLNSLLAWAHQEKPNFYPQHRKSNHPPIVYVMKDKMYYYFNISAEGKYILVASSEHDIFAEGENI